MLIECKPANIRLNSNHQDQLYRYISVSDVRIAVLTNGSIYQFFTDYDNPGRMDGNPFLEVDLRNLTDSKIESLRLFTKEAFSLDEIEKNVEELKYRQMIHDALVEEINNPSEELVHLISKKVYSGVLRKPRMKYFERIIKEEIRDVFDNDYILDPSDIITIDEEMEGFYIVRAIASEVIDTARISMRDRKSYCGILLDDNHHYPICRLYFNDLDNLVIAFFDSMQKNKHGSRVEELIAINNVSDIYKYKEKLLDTIRAYEKIKK